MSSELHIAVRLMGGMTSDGMRWCSDHKNFCTPVWVEQDDGNSLLDCYACVLKDVPLDKRDPVCVVDICCHPTCMAPAVTECAMCHKSICQRHYNLMEHTIVCHACLNDDFVMGEVLQG
jgi:hypothetical protein